ncbi:hypothetical protein VTN77DRAFT_4391 [Rasamsonia byssochlamydoides]|uniref:uncharacterized protein n=1 Tax=Rasamsonia byssochlamydoides TaxID=89139 RepID=UPI0037430A15
MAEDRAIRDFPFPEVAVEEKGGRKTAKRNIHDLVLKHIGRVINGRCGEKCCLKAQSKVGGSKLQGNNNKKENLGANQTRFLSRLRLRNPLACLRIIFYYDTFLCLWMHGSFYAMDYSLAASVPDIYKDIYQFNELQIGLSYLPRGGGIIVGGYCNGKLLDYNYRFIARKFGWTVNRVSGDDLGRFPIELARSRGSFALLAISTATLVGYGWAVGKKVHVAIPLILQFIQGFWGTCFYTSYNTLLVDMFPESSSTAAAAASITRCAMAAASVAILQPLLDATGRGWYFTVLGIWSGSCGIVAVCLIRKKGMEWRTKRIARARERNEVG